MTAWANICANPIFNDLPFKIETNRFNKIIMSPASNWHGGFQYRIGSQLEKHTRGGFVLTEIAIQTTDGIKVADVAWVTRERWLPHRRAVNMPIAPEICVEIISPSNSREEMLGKMQLYFANGAQEVWLCDDRGEMEFFAHDSIAPIADSRMCPDFPHNIDWD